MLPASLRGNYINKGLKYCGDPEYQTNSGNMIIAEKYKFISYNAPNVAKQLEAVGSLDNKTIVIDEGHNLINIIVGGLKGTGKQGVMIYKKLLGSKNTKILFLSGTPVINTPFELAIMFNIIRGLMEVLLFTIVSYTEESANNFTESCKGDPRIKYVDFNRSNKTLTCIINVYSWDLEFEQTVKYVENKASQANVMISYNKLDKYTLFPDKE